MKDSDKEWVVRYLEGYLRREREALMRTLSKILDENGVDPEVFLRILEESQKEFCDLEDLHRAAEDIVGTAQRLEDRFFDMIRTIPGLENATRETPLAEIFGVREEVEAIRAERRKEAAKQDNEEE